ncbi:MAG: alpha/beta hydrolase [Rhodocyclales bacterium]|nr:alpha/beta hydrolase [Rhodocyclales bacterium]MDB5889061.1 alpha/beta hydrolase [Rhodocyclales bacterium]
MYRVLAVLLFALASGSVGAETTQTLDIPTRPGVTQRLLVITPDQPKAVLVLFTGGDGVLRISPSGELSMGKGNFLIRTRQQWVDKGFVVALVDSPSDRQSYPFLSGFRQTTEHVTDIKAVIATLRQSTKLPIWLVGTSRGTQSVAFVATSLDRPDGPDGLVLTSTILNDPKSRSVPAMPLEKITVPTLVVHHQQDTCRICNPEELPDLMNKLSHASRRELVTFEGGISEGDPCEALAHHGYNGIEAKVADRIATWVLAQ